MFAAIAYDGPTFWRHDPSRNQPKAIRDELAKTKDFVGVTGRLPH
jgi:hypothetical protein